jgi:hypothetical protein
MKEQQTVGNTLETQERIHAEAHRRAVARNQDEPQARCTEAERGEAVDTTGALNWNNGQTTMSPAYIPSQPFPTLTPVAENQGGALSGIDAICGFSIASPGVQE